MTISIVDYYPSDYWAGDVVIPDTLFRGQTFHNTNEVSLYSCSAYLDNEFSATGNIYAYIYEHTGVFGAGGKPTGAYLAISDAVNVATIGTTSSFITFLFTGVNKITLAANTNYCLVFKRDDDTVGVISAGWDIGSPAHAGNYCYGTDAAWYASVLYDVMFYVYGDDGVVASSGSNFLIMF